MTFRSILFGDAGPCVDVEDRSEPDFFRDLNLDQIVDAITAGKEAYKLEPFFHSPLGELDVIVYRQEVFQDMDDRDVHDLLATFADRQLVARFTSQVRALEDDDLGYAHYHRARGFINATEEYCDAVVALASGLTATRSRSRGLLGLRDYLTRYVASDAFVALQTEGAELLAQLHAVRYCLLTKGDRVTVGRYDDESDYSEAVARTFERFRQGAVQDYRQRFSDFADYAALGILDLVAKVYPELFEALDAFCVRHRAYLDRTLAIFDREIQFYLSYLTYIAPLGDAGLTVGFPRMSAVARYETATDTYDLALAAKLIGQGARVVCNDIVLAGPERVLVVSGPNNGGKTTLARTFGQLHYLARLGCPVPGRDVHLFLCDQIFTHFERQEDITTLAGKLQDELNRLKADFDRATSDSVIILNEMFNSTTAQDALFLSRRILERVTELDALCVCVTFLDELATLNEKTVSMVSTVVPDDPATRTYKLVRKPADGRAYAHAIAEKYGLTYERLTGQAS